MNTNYENFKDEELIYLIHNKDTDAEEFLIIKYKDLVKIKSHSYFIVGSDKEDIVQEGMIGLFKAIRDYKIEKNVSFYSFADLCITRQIITAIKSATRQKHIPLNSYISLNNKIFENDTEKSFIDFLPDEKITNPEDLFIGQEDKSIIESFITDSLSQLECRVLSLYLQGKSYSQIANAVSKDEKSIDNALQRVRKKIEKEMITWES